MSFSKKNTHKWGVDVTFSLFYVAWESWQTAHYLFTVCTCTLGYDEEGCGFQFRSPGKFSYNQSILWTCYDNVMDLSIGILFFQESPGILHPPSCMDRPWI